jgi:hypothetical protein
MQARTFAFAFAGGLVPLLACTASGVGGVISGASSTVVCWRFLACWRRFFPFDLTEVAMLRLPRVIVFEGRLSASYIRKITLSII